MLSFSTLLSACSNNESTSSPPPSTLEWTWLSGSNAVNQVGAYGTQGAAAPSNVPGARYGAASWLDSSGTLWLFEGYGLDSTGSYGYLNDLWKYDPAGLEWTWVSGSKTKNQSGIYGTQGIAAPSNVPGARQSAVIWLDPNGTIWLFGGSGLDSTHTFGHLNDLWQYDPTTLEWTWVSGSNTQNQSGTYGTQGVAAPSNVPGARDSAVSWLDPSGTLWLFGGGGYDSAGNYGYLNDLWQYDPATLEWTWVSGSNMIYQVGSYGTQGTAAPSNVPGARYGAVRWLDPSGTLWLFGGWGYDSVGNNGYLNDLWQYDPATLEWTWISGSHIITQNGIYGTQGTAAPSNVPGGRYQAVSWLDPSGKLWLFGGFGLGSSGYDSILNDLWKYDPLTLEWTWVSGSDMINPRGFYGTKGTAALSNVPGARHQAVSWIDPSGNLWLFGGLGLDSAGKPGYLNDLWMCVR